MHRSAMPERALDPGLLQCTTGRGGMRCGAGPGENSLCNRTSTYLSGLTQPMATNETTLLNFAENLLLSVPCLSVDFGASKMCLLYKKLKQCRIAMAIRDNEKPPPFSQSLAWFLLWRCWLSTLLQKSRLAALSSWPAGLSPNPLESTGTYSRES